MNKKSFIDLTALLDVVLILFFAALINMANSADASKEASEIAAQQLSEEQLKSEQMMSDMKDLEDEISQIELELQEHKEELASLYGSDIEDLDDHQEIISKISVIDISLVGESNELYVNSEETDVHIIRSRMETDERERILKEDVTLKVNEAIANRDKSDIIFLKVSVGDREVYKYAYDYLIDIIDEVIKVYGTDKVLLSKEFD